MPSVISVRPVRAEDEEDWRALFRAYIAFYREAVSEEVIALTWRRLVEREDNMMALVAVDDANKAIGIATLIFHRSTWSPTWYCYLEDLFVATQARQHGVGEALINAAYAEADRRGATRTYWATQDTNATARRLYDRVGTLTEFLQYRR
jgi:GNAT superfamily N-acetyltransferase